MMMKPSLRIIRQNCDPIMCGAFMDLQNDDTVTESEEIPGQVGRGCRDA